MQRPARAPARLLLTRLALSLARTTSKLGRRLLPGLPFIALLAGALNSCMALPPAIADPAKIALPASRIPTSKAGELSPGLTPTKRSSGASLPIVTPDPSLFRPSATPSAGADRLMPTPSLTPRPLRISMLLYLDGERLARWNYLIDQTTLIADNVAAYSPSANGRFAALLKRASASSSKATPYSLWRMDLTNSDLVELLPSTPWLDHLSISPNGQWVAYGGSAGQKTIQVLPATQPGAPIPAGDCEAENQEICRGFSWSPNSQEGFWVDERGIWLFNLYRRQPALISPAQIEVSDPKGKK